MEITKKKMTANEVVYIEESKHVIQNMLTLA